MKSLLILTIALLAFVAADDDWDVSRISEPNIGRVHAECVEESKITEEQHTKVRRLERPDQKEIQDYVLCGLRKLGIFTEDKGFNTDRLMKIFVSWHLDEEKTREIVAKCMSSSEEEKRTPAERAFGGIGCLSENNITDLMRDGMIKWIDAKTKGA